MNRNNAVSYCFDRWDVKIVFIYKDRYIGKSLLKIFLAWV